jgi:head-tail adaptor
MLTARKYKKTVTLIFTPTTTDDYGKDVAGKPIEVLHTFADVVQTSNYKQMVAGERAEAVAMRFTIRYTAVEFNGVKYNGGYFTVVSVDNVNQADKELVITAQRVEK